MPFPTLFILLAIAVFLLALGAFIGGKIQTVMNAIALACAGAVVVIVLVKN